MKKLSILLHFIFFFSCMCSFAQAYHPMLKDSSKWFVSDARFREGGYAYTVDFMAKGDTLINSIHYQKMGLYYLHNGYSWITAGVADTAAGEGFIREDTVTRKVFYLPKDSTKEFLLYDFSLKKGDSIYISTHRNKATYNPLTSKRYWHRAWYKVDSVSTFNTLAGPRKKIVFNDSLYLTWIEGVGSTRSPLYIYLPFFQYNQGVGPEVELNCFIQDEQPIIRNIYWPTLDCDYYRVTYGINDPAKFIILVKSAFNGDELMIWLPEKGQGEKVSINCSDMISRRCSLSNLEQHQNGDETVLTAHALVPPGIYLIQITAGNHLFCSKVVKD